MEFCNKCGKIMEINPEPKQAHCSCGFTKLVFGSIIAEELNKEKEQKAGCVVDEKKESEGFPYVCPKCGHNMAEVKELGVFYGDEAGVYLFKCKKCGYTDRQADGCSNNQTGAVLHES